METETPASIDEEINRHLVLVADLRARKNSFLPIFRLPPEILANIFTHGARDYYHENSNLPIYRIPQWVNVSYVCRHWRAVALNCPTLWTYHFTISLRWTEKLLARSKRASLKICIYDSTMVSRARLSGLLEKLLSHAERIQELRLRVSPLVLPSKLSLCAPRLQILDIDGTESRPSEWTLTINDRDLPPLHTLKLTGCPLSWHSLNLSGLTTLFLFCVPSPKQNIVDLLAALSRMQRLTYLHLDRALASARGFLSSGAFDLSPKINTPSLARLFVTAPLSTVVALISRINMSLKTELRLEFQLEQGSSIEDYAQIPSFLAQRFTQSKDLSSFSPTIRSLAIHSPPYHFVLCASKHDDCHPYVSTNCLKWDSDLPLMISVGMEPSMTSSDWDHITSEICCSIPPMGVQSLHALDPPFSHDFWRKTLSHLHGLSRMKLSEGDMPDLACLLAERVETPKGHMTGDRDPAAGHTFVPALSKLDLYRIAFASEDADSCGDGVSEQSLLDALATREALRSRLTMEGCIVEGEESDAEDDEDNHWWRRHRFS